MSSKYKVGDKVVVKQLNKRTPKYIRDAIRVGRSRTIIGISYDHRTQHNQYHVGSNYIGDDISSYPFRAEELRPLTKHVGRPREKRIYRRQVV